MNDLKKASHWAWISIPMTFMAIPFGWALAHGAWTFLMICFLPGIFLLELVGLVIRLVIGPVAAPDILGHMGWPVLFWAQYLSYFMIIYLFIKGVKFCKRTRAQNIAKEQREKESSEL